MIDKKRIMELDKQYGDKDEVYFYLMDLESRFDKIKPNTYYLSYSGGADSHFLYWFIKEYLKRDDIPIVSVNTYMEHTEIYDRMKKYADVILIPKAKPFEIKKKYGIPCFSKEQDQYIYYWQNSIRKGKQPSKTTKEKVLGTYHTGRVISKKAREYTLSENAHMITHLCCWYLKEKPCRDYEKKNNLKPIIGTRKDESQLRKTQYNSCFGNDGKFRPIYDLDKSLIDKIYKKYNIEKPKIYDFISRTGCMGCPYGSWKGDTKKELDLLPLNKRKFVTEYFKESYDVLGIDYEHKQETLL